MKTSKLILLTAVALSTLYVRAQQTGAIGNLRYEDSLTFNPLHDFVSIPDPENNIWRRGVPSVTGIDTTYTGKDAIFALVPNETINADSNCFLITIPAETNGWGEGILSFYHNYNTDSLFNGGTIEVSYDHGLTWQNILEDKSNLSYNYIGLYSDSDTISGGARAFSGHSGQWVYTELYWHWFALLKKGTKAYGTPQIKFIFKKNTDPSDVNIWLIDGMVFRGYDIVGSATGSLDTKEIDLYPNPAINVLRIKGIGPEEGYSYSIFNILGNKVSENNIETGTIDISKLNPGIYLFVTSFHGNVVSRSKFRKE
jgi:hypothetical protein